MILVDLFVSLFKIEKLTMGVKKVDDFRDLNVAKLLLCKT